MGVHFLHFALHRFGCGGVVCAYYALELCVIERQQLVTVYSLHALCALFEDHLFALDADSLHS